MIFISPFILLISFFSVDNVQQKKFNVNEHGHIEHIEQLLQSPGQQSVLSFTTKIDGSSVINCLIYIPDDYNQNNTAFPLLVFLHGGNEAGSNLEKVKRHGPPKLINQGKSFPFIVVAPLLPLKFKSKWPPELVDEVIALVKDNFRVDEKRLYLTGVSVGGAGTWGYALAFPEKVAAIAPICGWGNPSQACDMKEVPVWAFHGAKDNVVSPAATTNMVNALKNCGADPKLTIYPNLGHDSWTKTYNNQDVYQWLLSHTKSDTTILNKDDKAESETKDTRFKIGEKEKPTALPKTIEPYVVTSLPISIKESSGLIVSNSNSFWTHNDSGNPPVLFNIDSTGKIIQIKRISNATNVDWEDLTSDEEGNYYIGDFGNNKQNRKELQIYKIPNPEADSKERIKATTISFSFPDQFQFPPKPAHRNFDMEAMINFKDSLYLFSKNNSQPYSGYCKMYRLPNTPGHYTAELIDSIFLGDSYFEASVTSAALSKDAKHLILLSYSKLFIFSCFKNADFFSGNMETWAFSSLSQKEGISFSDKGHLYITDENFHGIGGNLYSIHANTLFNASNMDSNCQ